MLSVLFSVCLFGCFCKFQAGGGLVLIFFYADEKQKCVLHKKTKQIEGVDDEHDAENEHDDAPAMEFQQTISKFASFCIAMLN